MAERAIMSAPHMVLVHRSYLNPHSGGHVSNVIMYINTVPRFVLEFPEILESIDQLPMDTLRQTSKISFVVFQAGFLVDEYDTMPAAMVLAPGDVKAVKMGFGNARYANERLLKFLAQGLAPAALPRALNAASFSASPSVSISTSRIVY